jgi:surface protein
VTLPDTSAVTDMQGMFQGATSLTSVTLPTTGAVTSMYAMFEGASSLTSVSLPKTGAVKNMQGMFYGATSLTSVTLPTTGAVTSMYAMFEGATSLTSVELPDTSAVTSMGYMFYGASSLTSVTLPDTSAVTDMSYMFEGASLSTTSYDALLNSWNALTLQNGVVFNGGNSSFSPASADARANIISTYGWTITDGGAADTIAPTVALTTTATTFAAAFTATATFSEAVTGFALDDITVANGIASNFAATSTSVYTFDVTPVADGAVAVDVAGSVAIDAAGNYNIVAPQLSVTYDATPPTVILTGPSGTVTAAFTVTATFSEAVTGFALDDITVANGTASSLVTGNAPVYTFTVTPTLGTTVSISIAANKITDTAGNANTASNTLSIQAGSPASEFATHKPTIKNAITGEAKRALRSGLASDQGMMTNTRRRFIADQSGSDANQNVAFFVDGSAKLKATHLDAEATAKGNFFSLQATDDGTWRKLAFGDFDVQTDDDKNVSGFLKGRMAFETNLNSTTMLGYFVGGQVGRSTLKGTFEGSQNSFGASVGGYLVQTLAKDVYADMFASLGANRNTLKLSNGTLDLDSVYSTTTSTIGGSVTGVYAMDSFEVWPTLAFTQGVTTVGNVGFTGVAYGLTDTTLSLDADKVSLTSLSFTPEVRVPFELQEGSDSSSMATFAPRYTCEQTGNSSSRNCGSGAAIGLTTASDDGLINLNAQFQYDKVGSTARRSIQLGFERKF